MNHGLRIGTIGLAALLAVLVGGCSGKGAAAKQTSKPASAQASDELAITPAAPAPTPIPYPNTSAAPRDVATGQATGKRMHKPVTIVAE